MGRKLIAEQKNTSFYSERKDRYLTRGPEQTIILIVSKSLHCVLD